MAYSFFYADDKQADGTYVTRKVRHLIGFVGPAGMSERAALRQHAKIMAAVNDQRGSVAPAVPGKAFCDLADAWRKDIAPTLSPSTVRQRESYLRQHIIPRFGNDNPQSMNVAALQEFATGLREKLSRKTVINVLSAIFSILDYAEKSGTRTAKVRFGDIRLGKSTGGRRGKFFTKQQAAQIIQLAEEPYKSIFVTAWATGLRAGELLALNVADLDFDRRTISVHKSADDYTREIRDPKTDNSTATLPMPSALEAALTNYLANHWDQNPQGYLFPAPRKTGYPRSRDSVVKFGLKPVLKNLGIPTDHVGLHAFRHGLATELANASAPLPALQAQMRHSDVKTTLKYYTHAVDKTQREAVENAAVMTTISTKVPTSTEKQPQTYWN